MSWGPKFTHNISLFYPDAILTYFNITPLHPLYTDLKIKITLLIEETVLATAKRLNELVTVEFIKDMFDIEEYNILPEYAQALEWSLSSPEHVGVVWGERLVQAKFIDTDILGGLNELIEIQHEAYPGTGNLGSWVSLYKQWISGSNNGIGDTLRKRISMMVSRGMAPFAELIETGNTMYSAYPTHAGKHTLQSFIPVYRRNMRQAYHTVVSMAELIIRSSVPANAVPDFVDDENGVRKNGFSWKSRTGKTVFVDPKTMKTVGGRVVGSGFLISAEGLVIKKWAGWLPR